MNQFLKSIFSGLSTIPPFLIFIVVVVLFGALISAIKKRMKAIL